jgi:DNA-directed RNA polymerase III subunit RPC6
MVYQYIKASENKGIWIKDLKLKTNLHQNTLSKVLKNLESRKIIKAVKSVKVNARLIEEFNEKGVHAL